MQVRQFTSTDGRFPDAELAKLATINAQLILCFADPAFFTNGAAEVRSLAQRFPQATVLGCSSAGEISSAGVTVGRAVVTAVHFADPGLLAISEPLASMADSEAAGSRIGAALVPTRPHTVIVLGQGVELNGSALIRGLRKELGASVALVGGLAGDAGKFERTFVISGDQVSADRVVALAFNSPKLRIAHGCFGGWRPFGPVRRVTRSTGNILNELDGEPAVAVYRRYLGAQSVQLPAAALFFPFSMLDDQLKESGVTRTILGMDESTGSITLAGEVVENGHLRLMCANADDLINGAEVAAEGAALDSTDRELPSLALLVSCVGRRLALGARTEEEVEAVSSVLGEHCMLTGFYSNGEISSFGDSPENQLHNQTMTVTRFIEEP